MTMFSLDTPDIDNKLQELEDEEIKRSMKEKGYSDEEIEFVIRNTHLHDAINRLEDIFFEVNEREEIINILLGDGWEREEIMRVFEQKRRKTIDGGFILDDSGMCPYSVDDESANEEVKKKEK